MSNNDTPGNVQVWMADNHLIRNGYLMNSIEESKPSFPWYFLALTFGFSWLVWLPAILANFNVISLPVPAPNPGPTKERN